MDDNLLQALDAMRQLIEDSTVPKNVRSKLQETIMLLEKANGPLIMCKARENIESLSENLNLESFVRTQLFNVAGLLEVARN